MLSMKGITLSRVSCPQSLGNWKHLVSLKADNQNEVKPWKNGLRSSREIRTQIPSFGSSSKISMPAGGLLPENDEVHRLEADGLRLEMAKDEIIGKSAY